MQFFQNKPVKILQILQQMCMQLRNLTKNYMEICKTLEQLNTPKKANNHADEVMAKLEYIRQSQLSVGMYDSTGCTDWIYDHL